MVVVAADSSPPTGQGPVNTGGIDGTAMDHRAGHPGQHSQEHELHPHCQGFIFFLHTSQDEHEGRCVGDAGQSRPQAEQDNEGQHQAAAG
mgnify:CR=1 FL=1